MSVSGLAPTPLTVPVAIDAGTTVSYDRALPDYPQSDWAYKLYLAGVQTLAVDGATDPDGVTYHVTLSAAQTATLNTTINPQPYKFTERLTNATTGQVVDILSGQLTVNPNIATLGPGDALTPNQRILAALMARMEGRITADCENYSIAGRSISRIPISQLEDLIGTYKYRVWRETSASSNLGQTVKAYFPPTGRSPLPPGLPPGGIIE